MILSKTLASGLGFGVTSAVITTLGLMIGLNASTGSKMVVIGGILTIAIADSLSDALGVHVSKETEKGVKQREVWEATAFTFIFKFLFTLTFLIPILLLPLPKAIIVNIVWGLGILSILTFRLARSENQSRFESLAEHLGVAIAVLLATNYLGNLIARHFN